jgi:uncharacterized protein (UPF0335 family)
MTKTVTIDTATFAADDLTNFLQRAIRIQAEQEALKEDYKALLKEAEDKTKLKAKKLRPWFKARYAAKTQEVIQKADEFEALNNAVDV